MHVGREVFPNAPLELVATEIRFTYVPGLNRDDAREQFATALRDLVPVSSLNKVQTVTVAPGVAPKIQTEDQFRLLNRASTLSVTLQPARLTIETTDYPQFEAFREILHRAVTALAEKHNIGGVNRIGLRYIDEIRVPVEIRSAQDWIGWVDNRLTAALGAQDFQARTMQGLVQYYRGDGRYMNFRFGAIAEGSALSSAELRRPRNRQLGPYFLLDIDSYWEPQGEVRPFNAEEIVTIVDDLHLPAAQTFVASITDKLKNEVFREAK